MFDTAFAKRSLMKITVKSHINVEVSI